MVRSSKASAGQNTVSDLTDEDFEAGKLRDSGWTEPTAAEAEMAH